MKQETYDAAESAAKEGLDLVREVLAQRDVSDDQLALARIGTSVASTFAKLYQANSAREATVVSIITQASPDAEEFRRLVQAALPGTKVATALGDGAKKKAKV